MGFCCQHFNRGLLFFQLQLCLFRMNPKLLKELRREDKRLYSKLRHAGFSREHVKLLAPLTLQINKLKKAKKAIILAHSYQTPDIIYGVADFIGDSYQLSRKAQRTRARTIIFCGVRFMAETAKILNPRKKVILPAVHADCSLADSITAADIRKLKKQHPGVPVVTYVNTSAAVKAQSDACCTSANALKIINSFPGKEMLFLPDELMLKNMAPLTDKKLIGWHGKCIVHEDFKAGKIGIFRDNNPGLKVLAHTECDPAVVASADFAGGTEGMIRFVKENRAPSYLLITECGLTERMRVELPDKKFLGMCALCPYMKQTTLPLILQALKKPNKEQVVKVPAGIAKKAKKALRKMFKLTSV
jgi:quinolinate synthase